MEYDRLKQILEVSRHMAETRALEPLLDYVIDEALRLTRAERGYLILVQPDQMLEIKVKRNQRGAISPKTVDQISLSVVNQVIESSSPLILDDAINDSRFDGARSIVDLKLRSIMCVPLITHGETIGSIYFENRSIRNRFSDEDLSSLTIFANQAAIAIENARLNDDLEARVQARTSELEKSWTELVEANQLRTVWLSNMSHDLRAPLGIAITALSLLQEGALGRLTDTQIEWVGKSLEAVQHAVNLINDIFYFFKLEGGGITLNRETIPLQPFLQSVFQVALGLPWKKPVDFKLDVTTGPVIVSLDPLRVRQVLLNLLTNAQKFTYRGQVILYAKTLDNAVLIGVKDTGEGIAADKLDRVFQRFQQVDDNVQRREKGAGLGLAICRELVEMHGGRIWVESMPGQGSNFMFTLPFGDATAAAKVDPPVDFS